MVNTEFYSNRYRPVEERPIYALTEMIASKFPNIPIIPVTIMALLLNIVAAFEILKLNFLFAAILIFLSFIFDKLDGSLAREKIKRGEVLDIGRGTFIDGFCDIIGITFVSYAVILITSQFLLLSPFVIAAPLLYWYVNAGIAAYLQVQPSSSQANVSILKQILSYSRSKEMIVQVITIGTGALGWYVVFHVLLFFYTIVLFIKKVK